MSNHIIQLNLIELNLVTMPTTVVVDPNSEFVESTVSRPAIAAKTAGPHRYTIVVPHNDDAVVNIGQAASTRINDTGITGRTKSHVHWHTTADPNRTMVALGGPTNEGWAGFQGNNFLLKNDGFMMVTENHSWMEAKHQLYLLSREHDAVVRTAGAGRRAVLQADAGEVDVVAKHHVYVTSDAVAVSATGATEPTADINYKADWTTDMSKAMASTGSKDIMTIVKSIYSAYDIVTKFPKRWKKREKGQLVRRPKPSADWSKWDADAKKFRKTADEFHKLFAAPKLSAGEVKIGAASKVGILAGNEVSAFGTLGASVGSALRTSISAGLSASLKASLFAGIGGMYTSVKGYKKVEISSEGETVVKGSEGVDVTAESGGVSISANKHAQVVADDGAYVQGKQSAYVGGGESSGYAFCADANGMSLGKFTGMTAFDSAKPVREQGITQDRNTLMMRMKQSRIEANTDNVRFKSPKVKINGDNSVTVKGSKILLD
ncbi:MAG: hypothetical protein FJ096_16125 [Deltaproteobacteria bacterium]|nr:hypothetical protein [Deltaproteobacteria bacterium]